MGRTKPSVLITGCAGDGIGNNLCRVFHQEFGFNVIATARSVDKIQDLAALGITTFSLDVNSSKSIEACYEQVVEYLDGKGLDYLYQNAGVNYTVPATDVVLEEVRFTFETNLFSVMMLNQKFLPLLIQAKGTIVATGSVAGVFPFWFGAGYNASKAALKSYLDTLRVELALFDVHVVNVITAGVRSSIARTKRTLPPESVFIPYADLYQRRLVRSQTSGMQARLYALSVVPQVVNSRGRLWNTNEVWQGGRFRAIWIMASIDWWFPGGVWGPYLKLVEGLRKKT